MQFQLTRSSTDTVSSNRELPPHRRGSILLTNQFNFQFSSFSLLILLLSIFFILGTDFSSIVREGKVLRPTDPMDNEASWVSADGETSVQGYQVAAEMQHIGQTLAVLQMGKYFEQIYLS